MVKIQVWPRKIFEKFLKIFSGFRTWTLQNPVFAYKTNVFGAFCLQKRSRFSRFGLFYKGFDEPKCGFDPPNLGQSARSWKNLSCSRGVERFFEKVSKDFLWKILFNYTTQFPVGTQGLNDDKLRHREFIKNVNKIFW